MSKMLEKMSLEDFLQNWNHQCECADEQEDEVLVEIMEIIKTSIADQCGIENPPIRFYNKKAQIEIIPRLTVVKDIQDEG